MLQKNLDQIVSEMPRRVPTTGDEEAEIKTALEAFELP